MIFFISVLGAANCLVWAVLSLLIPRKGVYGSYRPEGWMTSPARSERQVKLMKKESTFFATREDPEDTYQVEGSRTSLPGVTPKVNTGPIVFTTFVSGS